MHPGHGDPRRRLGGGWLQRGPAAQGRAGAAAVLGERGNPGGRGVCRGGLRATAGVGRLLELPRQTPSLSPPRSSCVGGVHSPPTVSAGWGGGMRLQFFPPPPQFAAAGAGQPTGFGPGPRHLPGDGGEEGGRIGRVCKAKRARELERGQPRGTAGSRLSCACSEGSGGPALRGSGCQRQPKDPRLPCHEIAVSQEISIPAPLALKSFSSAGSLGLRFVTPRCRGWLGLLLSPQDLGGSGSAVGFAGAGLFLPAVRRCPATPGDMEETLSSARSTHHSLLLS